MSGAPLQLGVSSPFSVAGARPKAVRSPLAESRAPVVVAGMAVLVTCICPQVLHTAGAVVLQFPALDRAGEPECCPARGGEASESAAELC